MKTLQEMLSELKDAGLSDSEIAVLVDLSQPTISRIRRGQHKSTNYETGKRIEALHQARLPKLVSIRTAANRTF